MFLLLFSFNLYSKHVKELEISELSTLLNYKKYVRNYYLFKKYKNYLASKEEAVEVYDYMLNNDFNDVALEILDGEELKNVAVLQQKINNQCGGSLEKLKGVINNYLDRYQSISIEEAFLVHIYSEMFQKYMGESIKRTLR